MTEDLQRAITAGVVEQTQGGHRCRVCDRDVTEILPHLRGKDHQNNLTWEAISNPAPHPFLLDALPPVVREAKQRGELDVGDKAVFSYKCRVCTKQSVVNGITPLKTHLEGNAHRKAMMLAASSVSPPDLRSHPSHSQPPQVVPPSTLPSSTQNPYPATASRNPDPQPYQPPSLQLSQYPPTYNQQPQHPSFDHFQQTRAPLPPTQSPACNQTLQSRLPPPHVSSAQPPAISLPHTSTAGGMQPNAPLPAAVPQSTPLPYSDFPGARGYEYDPELQRALTAELVAEVPRVDGPPSFKCRACDKDFTGSAPCLEHLRSDRHKKKAQAWTQQRQTQTLPARTQTPQPQPWIQQPGTPTSQSQTQTLQPQPWIPQPETQTPQRQTQMPQPGPDIVGQTAQDRWTRNLFDALPIVDRTPDLVDGSRKFRWTVVTGRPFPQSDMVYCNLSLPRGLVLIFNYCFTGHEHERFGAKQDSFNLKTLFHRMGYHVYLYEDYSKSQTEDALSSTLNNPFLKDYDSFIVFILSHGRDDQIFFTTSFSEEDSMKLDDVRYKFTDTACPPLSGKPKLFFVNFCRERAGEPRTAYDGMTPHNPGPKNIVTLYSCINTFRSPRNPEHGTFFVQAWCEVLATYAHNEELRDLHHRVCQRLEGMNGSVPELQEYYFKRFYFNPFNPQ